MPRRNTCSVLDLAEVQSATARQEPPVAWPRLDWSPDVSDSTTQTKTCHHCGGEVVGYHTRKYCSDECQHEAWLATRRAKWRLEHPEHTAFCAVCGAPFQRTNRSRTLCSDECRRVAAATVKNVPAIKTCSRCGLAKPIAEFQRKNTYGNKFREGCRECATRYMREYRVGRSRRAESALRRERHGDHVRAVQRVCQMRRRAIKRGATGSHTIDQLAALRVSQGDKCFYCGCDLRGGGEVEHKTPLSRGGSNSIENIAWSCKSCNRRKHTKTADEFMAVMCHALERA